MHESPKSLLRNDTRRAEDLLSHQHAWRILTRMGMMLVLHIGALTLGCVSVAWSHWFAVSSLHGFPVAHCAGQGAASQPHDSAACGVCHWLHDSTQE